MPTASPSSSGSGRILVDDVTHEYRDDATGKRLTALRNISFEARPGEFLCIVGASGCGKSTLLQLIAGLLSPTEGKIWADDRRVTGPGRDRGVVFQDYAMLPWKTVLNNVGLGPKLQGISKAERNEIALDAITLVGLAGFENSFPHELSGGMRQRAAVARTIAADPEVILMDEPFAAVDAQTRSKLQEELIRIWQRSAKTIIFITHSVEEAVYLGDRVIVLSSHPGRIREVIEVDTPRSARRSEVPSEAEAKTAARVLNAIRATDDVEGATGG